MKKKQMVTSSKNCCKVRDGGKMLLEKYLPELIAKNVRSGCFEGINYK